MDVRKSYKSYHAKIERNLALFDMRLFGCTYAEIARHFGISRGRVLEIWYGVSSRIKYPDRD